jgi:cold shock protein
MRGTVKFFDVNKGFGFLLPDDDGPDCFVHVSALTKANLGKLTEGDAVEFDVVPGKDGRMAAANLKIIC